MNADIKYKPSPGLQEDLLIAKRKSAKALLWIGIVSMIMFWAGLTSAYIVRQNAGNWLLFNVPKVFLISNAMIIISSICLLYAQASVKKNNNTGVILGAFLTLVFAFAFSVCQYKGWGELFEKGIYLGGKFSNPSGSFFLLFVLAHWAHLAGGVISLIVVLINSLRRKYTAENALGIELCAIYWHFLTILWLYLFLFLYFIR